MDNNNLDIKEKFSLATQNHRNNNFTEALKLYHEILEINPHHFESNFYLGTLYAQNSNFIKASELFNKAIDINPNISDLHSNLGLIYIQMGDFEKALISINKAIQINPNFSMGYNNLGLVNQNLGEFDKAEKLYNKSLELDPKNIDAYNNLGLLYKSLGDFKKSKENFYKAIEINQKFLPTYLNLGNLYKSLGEIEKSQKYYEDILKINPKFFEAYNNLMDLFERTNQNEKLEKIINEATKKFNNNLIVKLFYGRYLFKINKYFKAIEILENIEFNNNQLNRERIRSLILAKCYDQVENYEKSFHYFKKTNEINTIFKNKNINKNNTLKIIETRLNFLQQTENIKWTSVKLENFKDDPIFMIGFPRSGTTLLDTILRSHPAIEVIEEKPLVPYLINSISKITNNKLENLKNVEETKIKELRTNYFSNREKFIKIKDESIKYIDKMPLNIIHIAEIVRIFPKAKFIVSFRHPCDCVMSCYMQSFKLNDAMSNFLELEDAAILYNHVMSLWTKYIETFKFNYHEVKYENIVSNFDKSIQKVLHFLELQWSDDVLKFYKTAEKRNLISTPSYDQVNKPIYSKSIGRWKNYEKNMTKVLPILEPWIEKFKY